MVYKYMKSVNTMCQIEIVPCPFCSGDRCTPVRHDGSYGYSPSEDYVKCPDCGATGPKIVDNDCGRHTADAVNKWNRRTIGGIV